MMDLDKLNRWLTLAANLGVVAGIVFLAIEIGQNQVLLEQSNRTLIRDQELAILSATQQEVEQFNSLRAQIYLNREMSELWLSGRSGEFADDVDRYRYNQLCGAWFIANGFSYERSIALGRPEVLKTLPEQSRFGIDRNPGMRKCWEQISPFLHSIGFGEYVIAVESKPKALSSD
ncbi:MAG: hypothetical protein OEU59_00535 [Gammaproteobacteria bacterium]|nr:hypothetical protein [Gammaproteobacteria bacterium]